MLTLLQITQQNQYPAQKIQEDDYRLNEKHYVGYQPSEQLKKIHLENI